MKRQDMKRLTFLHGFGVISNDALKAFLCALVSIVRGLFGDLVSQLMSLETGDGSLLSEAEEEQGSRDMIKAISDTNKLV